MGTRPDLLSGPSEVPERADAARNRARVLASAADLYATCDPRTVIRPDRGQRRRLRRAHMNPGTDPHPAGAAATTGSPIRRKRPRPVMHHIITGGTDKTAHTTLAVLTSARYHSLLATAHYADVRIQPLAD